MQIRQLIKNTCSLLHLTTVLDELNFQYQFILNYFDNTHFRKKNPSLKLPLNRDLYETFQLNYQRYSEDGLLAAKEIINWYQLYASPHPTHILDWGCGTARIIQYMPQILPQAICYAADIHSKRIEWNRKYFPQILFDIIEYNQFPYPKLYFNLVYGISVFTHIHHAEQVVWLSEIHRILTTGGIAIVSTHGSNYHHQLSTKQLRILNSEGVFTNNYKEQGHLLMSTYNNPEFFYKMASQYFEIEAYYNGKTHPDKLGGQDIWVMKKR
ncbi:MAG: class I SAM-dependent methyltransferase [Sphingobacteriia bacterium]|nr:MAG: class I SAM-dependent methyltransferase [Sphingobacteriia bacterium]